MLKVVGTKRSFDFANEYPPCSPHKIASLDGTSESATKKRRVDTSNNQKTQEPKFYEKEAEFLSNNSLVDNETLKEWLPKQKQQKFPPPSEHEKFFSLLDVKFIIAKAIEQTNQKARNEYEKVLVEKLQEQYESFLKFNQDNIHRQLQTSTHDYMS